MKNKIALIGSALAVIGVAIWMWSTEPSDTTAEQNAPPAVSPFSAAPSTTASMARPGVSPGPSIVMPPDEPPTPLTQEEEDYLGEKFNLDPNGNLVVDKRAQATVEKLYALYTPEQQAQRLQELSQELPPAAHRRVVELVEQYKNYSMAVKQTFPPGTPIDTVEDAFVQMESISAIRVAHFGKEAAQGMFGDEEKLNRQLLGLMRLEKDESLTLAEKAERAQALISQSPDLAAIEKRNRESKPN